MRKLNLNWISLFDQNHHITAGLTVVPQTEKGTTVCPICRASPLTKSTSVPPSRFAVSWSLGDKVAFNTLGLSALPHTPMLYYPFCSVLIQNSSYPLHHEDAR